MRQTRIFPKFSDFPGEFHSFLKKYPTYDSSCSKGARVFFFDGDGGFYLKTAPAGALKTEADMTRYFHGRDLGTEVLEYLPLKTDWLLTRAVPGENCTVSKYRDDPRRLCDTLAVLLRRLHETDHTGCPVPDRCETYRATARRNHDACVCDLDLFPEGWGFSSGEEAWHMVETNGPYLKTDTLLHGDYCLPNIMLDDWRFSGFIDLDSGGVGDRHIDLFWGVWSLFYNLKTNAFHDRFLDAYGRDVIEPELLRTVAAFEVFG